MKKEMYSALNEHINFEIESAYIYLQLSLIMEDKNYKGYAAWLRDHFHEELKHGDAFIKFMQERGQKPVLNDIKCHDYDITEPLQVAQLVYEHEQKVSQRIYKLTDTSRETGEYAVEIFLHSFVKEQTEEEDITRDILEKFTMAGNDMAAKLFLDRELGSIK